MGTDGLRLASSLRAEIAALELVLQSLEEERHALENRDPERIEASTRSKDKALESLLALQRQRHEFTPQGGDSGALSELIARLDNSVDNLDLQSRLLDLGTRCEALNTANKILVERLNQHTRSALRILRQGDVTPGLYSGSGTTSASADSHSLGKA